MVAIRSHNVFRDRRVATKLAALDADIIVVTEGARELLPADGNVVDAGSDWGYALKPKRRIVIVWSRLPISLENIGEKAPPQGAWPPRRSSPPDVWCVLSGFASPGGTRTSTPAVPMPPRGRNICNTSINFKN